MLVLRNCNIDFFCFSPSIVRPKFPKSKVLSIFFLTQPFRLSKISYRFVSLINKIFCPSRISQLPSGYILEWTHHGTTFASRRMSTNTLAYRIATEKSLAEQAQKIFFCIKVECPVGKTVCKHFFVYIGTLQENLDFCCFVKYDWITLKLKTFFRCQS